VTPGPDEPLNLGGAAVAVPHSGDRPIAAFQSPTSVPASATANALIERPDGGAHSMWSALG
jgi:hypothetical protein